MSDRATLSAINVAVESGIPVVLIGKPGTGKTESIKAIGKALDRHTEIIISSLRDQTDFGGLPVIGADGTVTLAAPAWAHRLAKAARGLCVFDEINTCSPNVQAALLRVVLERIVGDLDMGPNVSMIAAMNPPSESAGGSELTAPLSNRFMHLNWTMNGKAFIEGTLTGWETPPAKRLPVGWESNIRAWAARVAGFINVKPALVLDCPTDETKQGQPWPSPRSWTMLTRALGACDAMDYDEAVRSIITVGTVGTGAGAEFLAWVKALDLPDPEECLENPTGVVIPDRGDKAFTLLASIASAVVANVSKKRYLNAWAIFYAAAQAGKTDVAAASVRGLAQILRPSTTNTAPSWLSDADVRKALAHDLVPFRNILQKAGILG